MHNIDENWIYDEVSGKLKRVENGIFETVSKNGYKFALSNLTPSQGWDVDRSGDAFIMYGLQVSKDCPFEFYSGVNDFMLNVLGRRPIDVYTKEITMSNGREGYEYGMRLYPRDVQSLYRLSIEAEDAIRKFMLDRGFVEVIPAVEVCFSAPKTTYALPAETECPRGFEHRKSLVSRLTKKN